MQRLMFGGKLQSKSALAGSMFDVGIKYTIDLVSQNRLNENFTILSQTFDNDNADQRNAHEEHFGATFRVNGVYKLRDFIDFANTNALRLAISNSDGSAHETLVANDSSSSL